MRRMSNLRVIKKRILSHILMTALMITMFSSTVSTEAAGVNITVNTFAKLQAAITSAPTNGTEYVIGITNDINFDSMLSVLSGRNITIQSAASGATPVLTRNASRHFSITQSTLSIGDIILDGGGGSSGTCGGVDISSGSFKMEDGAVIRNCYQVSSGAGVIINGGTFTMNGGTIMGNNAKSAGGGVHMNSTSAVFIMNGGVITGNTADGSTNAGSGVFARGIFNMNGGEISNNIASASGASGAGVCVYDGGTFTMGGSTGKPVISGNASPLNGGGVFISSGTLTMYSGEIKGNSATGGGGVYVSSGCKFTLNGGSLNSNTGKTSGGGIYVSNGTLAMSGSASVQSCTATTSGGGIYLTGANAMFTMSGGTVSGNKTTSTSQGGGGVYVISNATFQMSGGMMSDNTTYSTQSGGGVYVVTNGIFKMSGQAVIQKCTAGVSGGGVYVSGSSFEMQGQAIIQKCTATTSGGGVHVATGTFNMYTDTVIEECKAANGGGIYSAATGTVKVTGATIRGNTANTNGGGIYTASTSYTTLTVDNKTVFSDNAANMAYVYTATQKVSTIDFPLSTSISFIGTPYYGQLYKLDREYPLNNFDINYTSSTPVVNYKITYDANGGSGTVADTNEYMSGTIATLMSGTALSYEGYHFCGWNTDKWGSGTSYNSEDTITMTSNVTLYAVWEKDDYIVQISLLGSANWNDLGGNVAVTFSADSLYQTAIFNPGISMYSGYPQAGAVNGIALPPAGDLAVSLYLPTGYTYKLYKNSVEIKKLIITNADLKNCLIDIRINKTNEALPWGKQIYKSLIH